jgi:hypothetical protein
LKILTVVTHIEVRAKSIAEERVRAELAAIRLYLSEKLIQGTSHYLPTPNDLTFWTVWQGPYEQGRDWAMDRRMEHEITRLLRAVDPTVLIGCSETVVHVFDTDAIRTAA